MALVVLSVVEQRLDAVRAVLSGAKVTEVATAIGVSRQSVHSWVARYLAEGLAGLADRSHRPGFCPHQVVGEAEAFLDTAQQHRLFAFFHIAAYTGARRGELLNLQWSAIDLDGKKITITGSTAMIGGERVNGTTKSGRTRVVSIDDATVAVLRQHKADQAADQLRAGDSWRGTKDG